MSNKINKGVLGLGVGLLSLALSAKNSRDIKNNKAEFDQFAALTTTKFGEAAEAISKTNNRVSLLEARADDCSAICAKYGVRLSEVEEKAAAGDTNAKLALGKIKVILTKI